MIKLLLILSILTFSLSSCGQTYREFNFQGIGMSIRIPGSYLIQDNFPSPSFLDASGKEITDSAKLKDLEADLIKGLLVVSSSYQINSVSFNLAWQTAKTGNFEEYYAFSKNMQEFMAKQQMTEYDTIGSIITVGNIQMHKYLTYSIKANPVMYSGIYLASIKNQFLIIKADYTDKSFGDEMEKAILTSKFH